MHDALLMPANEKNIITAVMDVLNHGLLGECRNNAACM